ncbi:MAG: leucyl aminopeptidase [Lachnospiraceae bacterium]|nr:leucyl aminopeptidase [Lachnospiraceae bacterium]
MRSIEVIREENEAVMERLELVMERMQGMQSEETVKEPFRSYFAYIASFLLKLRQIARDIEAGIYFNQSLEELKAVNESLYHDILPEQYEKSYANPAYAKELFGDYGELLSVLYAEARSVIPAVYECRLFPLTVTAELVVEIYNYFEEENEYTYKDAKRAIYYFVHDYAEDYVEHRMRETLDPTYTFAEDIIMECDLSDLRYLYRFGDYITENELQIAAFLNEMPEEDVKAMADTYTEGYIRGFDVMGADLSKKEIVGIRTCIGFERMMRYAFENFKKIGKKLVVYRVALDVINKKPGRKVGYYATSPNLQYEYDHRFDKGLFFDKVMKERFLAVSRLGYEKYKVEAATYAGPAVLETFGEPDFNPVNKEEAVRLDEKQQKLNTELTREMNVLVSEYMKQEELSFTIIAYPLPTIGEKFKEIFAETVKVNTLPNDVYHKVQQTIIDALDLGEYVKVTGKDGNQTDIKVMLYELADPEKETIFENCTADVNIPVGEVFTSPKLTGTCGTLHVSQVYLNGLEYKNLHLTFENGKIQEYTCTNFENQDENEKFVKENLLMNHETLALGEFAIGTNTTAYRMGQKYGIQRKLPILIAEKTGPHFAVGDTCYKMSEDHKLYNANGKEIVARDNEVSILRKTDMENAYYNCHTDITIPYNEIAEIAAYTKSGERIPIIENGRFVLPGTELLNEALDR